MLEIASSGLYTKCNPIIINHVVRRSLTVAGRGDLFLLSPYPCTDFLESQPLTDIL